MESVVSARPSLPPIKIIDSGTHEREEHEYRPGPHARSTPATATPAAVVNAPFPLATNPGHDPRDAHADPRQTSLPSLHEALGGARHTPYQAEPPPPATRRPLARPIPSSPPSATHRDPRELSPHRRPRSYVPTPTHPPHGQSDVYEQRRHEWADHHSVASTASYRQRTPPSAITHRPPLCPPPDHARSYEHSPQAVSSRSSHFAFGPAPPTRYTTAPPSHHSSRSESTRHWPPPEPTSAAGSSQPQPYADSVRRHLDLYDFELALNEIAEHSTVTLDFARSYAARLHHSQRLGVAPAATPAVTEVDDVMHKTRQSLEALANMRDVLVAHQASYQQHAREHDLRREESQRIDSIHPQDEPKNAGGFPTSEPKKRRGRNAAPGRCHGCNRAETPEWRRGPDGARTLCNACGLHYAKLTRKIGASKAAATGSSLRPKTKEEESDV